MPISYTAGKPEERKFTVLPAGEYNFRVLDAEEKRSKTGNDMIEVKLDVFKGEESAIVYDYLVFAEKSKWKVDHFLKCVGLLPEEGTNVDISGNDLIGHQGRVKLRIGKTDKNNDRNEVDAYLWEDEF